MHWCGDEFRIMALLAGQCNWTCAKRAIWYRVWRVQSWYYDHTELQRRDMIWGVIWFLTVIAVSL